MSHVIIFWARFLKELKLTKVKLFALRRYRFCCYYFYYNYRYAYTISLYLSGFHIRSSFLYAYVFISCNRDWHLGLDFSAKLVADKEAKEARRNPVADHSRCSESMVAFLPEEPPSVDMIVVAEGVDVVVAAVEDCGNKSDILVVDGDEQ